MWHVNMNLFWLEPELTATPCHYMKITILTNQIRAFNCGGVKFSVTATLAVLTAGEVFIIASFSPSC